MSHLVGIRALQLGLIGATLIVLTAAGMAATITVHAPDSNDRVFVDVVGNINDEDFKTFKEKTDQIYQQMVVTLTSSGGSINSAVQIGEQIRKRRMSTFVPGSRSCTSACALIWLAGVPRTVGDTPHIGFHAAYDPTTRRETGVGNAVVGAYLRDMGVGYKAIVFMTRKGPTSVEWLTPDLAKELGVAWTMLQPPRAIPILPQSKLQSRLQPPPEVSAAWSKSARSSPPQQLPTNVPVTTSPSVIPVVPLVTTSREPVLQQSSPTAARPDRIEPSSQQSAASAQRVVLFEEVPADPNGRRFVGFVIWRTVSVTPGPGQPPQLAIRADIEVPERRLAVTWLLRRNTDKGLPATHAIEIMFKLPADFPEGGISNVPGMLMKQGETARGVPLAGVAVKVTPGYYMIGLSNQQADKERNLQVL